MIMKNSIWMDLLLRNNIDYKKYNKERRKYIKDTKKLNNQLIQDTKDIQVHWKHYKKSYLCREDYFNQVLLSEDISISSDILVLSTKLLVEVLFRAEKCSNSYLLIVEIYYGLVDDESSVDNKLLEFTTINIDCNDYDEVVNSYKSIVSTESVLDLRSNFK